MRGGRAAELAAVLILALGTWLGFAAAGPPGLPGRANEPPNPSAFQLPNAMAHLRVIAETPHPLGTTSHDRVRDYLVDQLRTFGLTDVHVQSAIGFNTLDGPIAATVANVVGRKRGTGTGPAVLLMAHYDAVPRSFGAGDDGAAVAAILETARAIADGPPLDRDLIVVFSDAEEEGLLGAEAFVSLHPWAKDVGVVLNFDGRGNTGPVYMFQTSPGNAPLIAALAHVVGARTNSLTGEVYRHLPSDTDMSIWLHSGLSVGALNFAHVGGYDRYHTPLDNMATFDPRVLQQMGNYALSLTNTLGRSDLHQLRTTDQIYFTAPVVGLVHYAESWGLIVGTVAFALAILIVATGVHRRTLTIRGIGRGGFALLVTLVVPAIVTLVAWRLISLLHPGYREILQRDPYNSLWYLLAAMAGTVAIAVTVQLRAGARSSAMEIAVAPLLLFGAVGLAAGVLLPGVSYLFGWPLLAATLCAFWWHGTEARAQRPQPWLALFALPALLLWPPLVRDLEVGLTAAMLPFCAFLLALTLAVIVMPLQLTGELRRWIVRGAVAVTVGALVAAELTANFSDTRRRPDSLSYVIDADSAKAWWISFDHAADSWTRQVLGDSPAHRDASGWGLSRRGTTVLAHEAGAPSLPATPVHLLEDSSAPDGRRIHLHIDHIGVGQAVSIVADSSLAIREMVINGRALRDGHDDRYSPQYHMGLDGTVLRYFGVPEEGVDLRFTATRRGPAVLTVITGTEALPPLSPRPPTMMSKPFVPTDMTFSVWSVKL